MRYLILCMTCLLFACNSNTETQKSSLSNSYEEMIKANRKETQTQMLGKNSPLTPTDRKTFVSLNYFKIDSNFKVQAAFQTLLNSETFKMKTNTERVIAYQKYAKLTFHIDGNEYQLIAYKSLEHKGNELFIPFNDLTNGKDSYASGRFMDVNIPEGDSITLDFNNAYNPYCAYNPNYSCPIPPAENFLNIRIEAGEKKYKNDH